jgi:hypothetical protein
MEDGGWRIEDGSGGIFCAILHLPSSILKFAVAILHLPSSNSFPPLPAIERNRPTW